MQRTTIYLDPDQTEELDRMASAEHISRAALIRRIIARALANYEPVLQADLDAIDASFGAIRDIEPVVRERGARARHLDRMWQLES